VLLTPLPETETDAALLVLQEIVVARAQLTLEGLAEMEPVTGGMAEKFAVT